MKKYSQVQDFISILMIFVLLIGFSGCTTSKIAISGSEIPVSAENCYTIDCRNFKYYLENVSIVEGILYGKINTEGYSCKGDKIHIYACSDSLIMISTENVLNISLNGISKVVIVKFSAEKTELLTKSIEVGLFILLGISHLALEGM